MSWRWLTSQRRTFSSLASTSSVPEFDLVVVGGGIVGLSTALQALVRFSPYKAQAQHLLFQPDGNSKSTLRVAVLDKCSRLSSHQSSHNSHVLHAGLYYRPNSQRAALCVPGAERLRNYCDYHKIHWKRVGKLIVATKEEEFDRLDEIYQRSQQNSVPGVSFIESKEKIQQLEPFVAGKRAILSENTGIVDFPHVAQSFVDSIEKLNGKIFLNFGLSRVEMPGKGENQIIRLFDEKGKEIRARHVITCAGLYSDIVAEMFRSPEISSSPSSPPVLPFRGTWFLIKPEFSHFIRRNIYPVPNPQFPFLGIHFTPSISRPGTILIGPTATLAFSREGYKWTDFHYEEFKRALKSPEFHSLVRRHWSFGFHQMACELFPQWFLWKEIQQFLPQLQWDHIEKIPFFHGFFNIPATISGVRAQAVAENGDLIEDFLFQQQENLVFHVRNAPSPAATSCLTIGEKILQEAGKCFNWD